MKKVRLVLISILSVGIVTLASAQSDKERRGDDKVKKKSEYEYMDNTGDADYSRETSFDTTTSARRDQRNNKENFQNEDKETFRQNNSPNERQGDRFREYDYEDPNARDRMYRNKPNDTEHNKSNNQNTNSFGSPY